MLGLPDFGQALILAKCVSNFVWGCNTELQGVRVTHRVHNTSNRPKIAKYGNNKKIGKIPGLISSTYPLYNFCWQRFVWFRLLSRHDALKMIRV